MTITKIRFVQSEDVPGFGMTTGLGAEQAILRGNAVGVRIRKKGAAVGVIIPWPRIQWAHIQEDEPEAVAPPRKAARGG